jgi:hypothetical protein
MSFSADIGGSIGGSISGAVSGAVSAVGGALGGAFDPTAILSLNDSVVRPTVKIGSPMSLALNPLVEPKMSRVVVDNHLHLPGMFEIWFVDEDGGILEEAGIKVGQVV